MTIRRSEHSCELVLPLALEPDIAIRDESGAAGLPGLGKLLGIPASVRSGAEPEVTLAAAPPPGEVELVYGSQDGAITLLWLRGKHAFHLAYAEELSGYPARAAVWHYAVLCAGIASILRGTRCLILHAAMLDAGGSAILLCGDSGVGKSTSAERWRRCGHRAFADDMVLLEYDSDGRFFAHALPTWSRCRKELELPVCSAATAVPVSGVLGVARGEREETVERISRAEFFGGVARSCFFHCLGILKRLPPDVKSELSRRLAAAAGLLADRFPPYGLFARLDGDLPRTLNGYRERSR